MAPETITEHVTMLTPHQTLFTWSSSKEWLHQFLEVGIEDMHCTVKTSYLCALLARLKLVLYYPLGLYPSGPSYKVQTLESLRKAVKEFSRRDLDPNQY